VRIGIGLGLGHGHLQTTSTLRNAGNPAAGYNDADGTPNDIGSYGGPLSDWD
jgi:hypothetical protein